MIKNLINLSEDAYESALLILLSVLSEKEIVCEIYSKNSIKVILNGKEFEIILKERVKNE